MSLQEINPSRLAQPVSGEHVRWLHDDDQDLFLWEAGDGSLVEFHFTVGGEILRWSLTTGFATGTVDDGETGREGAHKMSPIIRPDPALDVERRTRLGRRLGEGLEGLTEDTFTRLREVLSEALARS